MVVNHVYGCPYSDKDGDVLNLDVSLDEGEVVRVGEEISILMIDDSFLYREVKLINPRLAGDFAVVSNKTRKKVESGEYGESKEKVTEIKGKCNCTLVVMNVPHHDVKTEDNIAAREFISERMRLIDLTPYKEFTGGKKTDSITAHTREGYCVPQKVLTYLQLGEAYMMCPGIYNHPFKPGTHLLGPYYYTDGLHFWDRDTWKYVAKYGLVLPEAFIDYVMSDDGTAYIEKRLNEEDAWSDYIKIWKQQDGCLCLLPDDAGSIPIDEF